MRRRGVGTLVVINDYQHPVGLVTDRDLVLRVLAELVDPQHTPVEAVMTRHPKTVMEKTSIEQAVELMSSGGYRRLPVVSDAGEVVGMVSLSDVLELSAENFKLIRQILTRERPHQVH